MQALSNQAHCLQCLSAVRALMRMSAPAELPAVIDPSPMPFGCAGFDARRSAGNVKFDHRMSPMPFGCAGFDAPKRKLSCPSVLTPSPMPFGCAGFDAKVPTMEVEYLGWAVSNAFRLCGL